MLKTGIALPEEKSNRNRDKRLLQKKQQPAKSNEKCAHANIGYLHWEGMMAPVAGL